MDGMLSYALYAATVLGALALWMMMPRGRRGPWTWLGAVLGVATLGGLWLGLSRWMTDSGTLGEAGVVMAYQYVFSALAIIAGVRVITHTRPVYSALWFVMVVLSMAGLVLILAAEFIAFAMVIIYGGAILVTYLFVIMLATQSVAVEGGDAPAAYERRAREPLAAIAAGFLLLAMLLGVMFGPLRGNDKAAALSDQVVIEGGVVDGARIEPTLPHRSADKVAEGLAKELGEARGAEAAEVKAAAGQLRNVERLGLELFEGYPLGLELAGVLLLVSLVGAVVIARQRVQMEPQMNTDERG